MKKLALVFMVLFMFSCNKSMNDVKPFKEADTENFRQLDNEIVIVGDEGDEDAPILDP